MIAVGCITEVKNGWITAKLPCASIGSRVSIGDAVFGTIAAVRRGAVTIAPDDDCEALTLGTRVRTLDRSALLPPAPAPDERTPFDTPMWTGVRAIDALLPIARGARIGIFGSPGAGKSTLLHTIARGAEADAIVIALVGERGCEAEEWSRVAPPHSTIVCATSDRSASRRIAAAERAMMHADALCRRGLHVLVILDSLARYAYALRERGVGAGEPPGRGGFPPSVFAQMARLLEIGGARKRGSIALVASVLSDGDERDPVSDAARSLLDGHIELSPRLAARGHFPAIDVPSSTSRTAGQAAAAGHRADASVVLRAVDVLHRSEDARSLGVQSQDEFARRAEAVESQIEAFLRQSREPVRSAGTLSALARLADTLR